jgi:type III pantothenate kinase
LAIDIGNSSIKFGIFDDDRLTSKFSFPIKRDYTVNELAAQAGDRMIKPIDAAIVCSVVPEIDETIARWLDESFHIETYFVRSTDDFGLKINFDVETTGADRLVNSFAAAEKYGVPCVVVSFGTATTIDVINAEREYLGGLIAPGMKVNAKALSLAASKLPEVDIRKPEKVIGRSTETSIQSGIVYGQIAMAEQLIKKVIAELGDKPKVIATGGFAEIIAPDITYIDIVDGDLTLEGLNRLWQRS